MKTENRILISGLIFAALVSVAVFVKWQSFADLALLGNIGHFLSNEVYNTYIGIVVIYVIVLACRYRDLKGIFWQGLFILLVLTVFHLGIKQIFGQWTPRPSGNSGGFPSGHSQAVFALAYLMSARNTKLSLPSFFFAMVLAWSRIYSAHFEAGEPYEPAHYPYQVMFGSFFGVIITYYLFHWTEKIRIKKLNKTENTEKQI